MRERDVEHYLVTEVDRLGLHCFKFLPDTAIGVPDRIVLLPYNHVHWIEMKTEDGQLSYMQCYRHRQLKSLGHKVYVLWSKEDVDTYIEECKKEIELLDWWNHHCHSKNLTKFNPPVSYMDAGKRYVFPAYDNKANYKPEWIERRGNPTE